MDNFWIPDPHNNRCGSATLQLTHPTKQCCGAGAATFRVEPEPIFLLSRAERRSRLLFRRLRMHLFNKQKKESLVVVTEHDLKAVYKGIYDPNKTCIINSLFKSTDVVAHCY